MDAIATRKTILFDETYRQYRHKVYQHALSLTRSQSASEDILQEVFIKIWLMKHELSEIENIEAFLFIVTRNFSTSYLRRQRTERKNFQTYQLTQPKYVQPDEPDEVYDCISDAIESLAPQQKLVYKLGRNYGWKREKIALSLKLSPLTVKAHMQNALRSLKKSIQERMVG